MKLFTSAQIREADEFTIKNEPIASIDLMERAALACKKHIVKNYSNTFNFKIFAGPGNNGGDGLAIARMLAEENYTVTLFIVQISDKYSTDFQVNLERLKTQHKVDIVYIRDALSFPKPEESDIVIDAIFGSGLTRELKGLPKDIVTKINESKSKIIAIDIPSGLFAEENNDNKNRTIIKANVTLTFQFPKISFLFPENENYVGNWKTLDIGLHRDYIENAYSPFHLLEKPDTNKLIKKRSKFSHKGDYGHALLIAGSYGTMGAAILAAKACLRAGAGLVTAHIPKCGYNIMQTSAPEVMVNVDPSDLIFTEPPDLSKYTAIGIGPGLGVKTNSCRALKTLLEKVHLPIVLDADALNILSQNKELLQLLPENSILTPHPGEFKRLIGKYKNDYDKIQKQIQFAQQYRVILIVKGAHTSIASPNGICYFNSTGNSGMATAGSGDVLTGIILSLLAQNYPAIEAALLGAYLHGLAGDLTLKKQSKQSLIASDIIKKLGKAFKKLQQ